MTTSTAESALVAYLLAQSTLTAVVKNRISPMKAAEGESLPILVYNLVGKDQKFGLKGCSGLSKFTFKFHAIGDSEAVVNAVIEAFESLFETPYAGPMGTQTCFMAYIDDTYSVPEDNFQASDIWPHHKTTILKLSMKG